MAGDGGGSRTLAYMTRPSGSPWHLAVLSRTLGMGHVARAWDERRLHEADRGRRGTRHPHAARLAPVSTASAQRESFVTLSYCVFPPETIYPY